MSKQRLNISKEGDSTTSFGNLLQCLVTLTVKKSFLTFRWNLLYFILCPLPLVLSLSTPEKSLSVVFSASLLVFTGISRMSPEPSLLQDEDSQLFQSFSHSRDVPVPSSTLPFVLVSSSICMPLLYWEGQNWTQQWPDVASPVLSRGEGSLPLACWQCFA